MVAAAFDVGEPLHLVGVHLSDRGTIPPGPFRGVLTNQQAQPKLALKRIQTAAIPLPPLAEQHRIVARVDELMSLLDSLQARLTTAQTTHASFASAAVHHLDA